MEFPRTSPQKDVINISKSFWITDQAQYSADDTASNRVNTGLSDNHFFELAGTESNRPEYAVLPGSCRNAHGDAVNNIEHSNQGNQY